MLNFKKIQLFAFGFFFAFAAFFDKHFKFNFKPFISYSDHRRFAPVKRINWSSNKLTISNRRYDFTDNSYFRYNYF